MKTKHFLQSIIDVSREAGLAVLEVYNSDFTVERKEDKSPLTMADRRSHRIISSFLKKQFSLPVLSEEGRDVPYEERRKWEYYWLVDPLDGTKEFVKRQGDFTINIALICRDKPVAGVIYVPVTDVLYYAQKDEGAFKVENGKATKLPLKGENDLLTIVGSRSHATPELEQYILEMKKRYGELEVISRGSSLKFCMIAEGRADVYPRLGPTMEWDTAAGQIIVEEAGGQVIEFESRTPILYNKEHLLNPFFLSIRGNRYV